MGGPTLIRSTDRTAAVQIRRQHSRHWDQLENDPKPTFSVLKPAGTELRALFVENIGDPRLVERIARETGTTVDGTLCGDVMSPPGSRADTYLKLMAHNADRLLAAVTSVR